MLSAALYTLFFISVAYSASEKGKAGRNYWGPAVQKGAPWPDYVAEVFFFLGSFIMCRIYK